MSTPSHTAYLYTCIVNSCPLAVQPVVGTGGHAGTSIFIA